MFLSFFLVFHICAGAIALLAGYSVIVAKKGQMAHKYLGRVYVVAMLALGLTGTYIAIIREIPLSMLNGLVLCYFVLSSINTIWQAPKQTNAYDKLLFTFVILITIGFGWYSYLITQLESKELGGFGIEAYLVFGSVMVLCCFGDCRFLIRGGLSGNSRLVRHLWRMFFPLLMSTAAFFLGQAKHLPESIQRIELLLLPVVLVVLTTIYWITKMQLKQIKTKAKNL
ncbi:DUF2306 domain-containing protein [Psychrosphaera sp. B3R10]|uniref:DUF2306 domain-containing protein n=1 Tax=unclassified Psychrosphaera TaxID=2641570 RepID=UPI001C0942D4|nr:MULTISPECIES: DUF2306 domain-containing protein [unclassified Psychrosphaera]MBU2883191.1 DUF2306 domain-containing protein [Psychrosphaera sp. I2R16]MBU2988647.1 DUF2306 domain-containing protein [Psychrosphaera sp. B3R10]